MIARIVFATMFIVIGAVAATALTAASAAVAFVTGIYIGSEMKTDETKTAEKE